MNRRFRAFAALAAIAAFVFTQAIASAYACAGPVADPVAVAQMKAQMGDDGGLCEQHCATGKISFEAAKPASSSIPAMAVAPLRIASPAPVHRAIVARPGARSVAGPAPPLIRSTVLRI